MYIEPPDPYGGTNSAFARTAQSMALLNIFLGTGAMTRRAAPVFMRAEFSSRLHTRIRPSAHRNALQPSKSVMP